MASRANVDPVVDSPTRIIDTSLHFAFVKARKQNLADIRFVIAIGVGKKDDVRSSNDDDSTSRGNDAVRRRQVICPNDRLVHPTVAIVVLQEFHFTELTTLRFLGSFATHELPPKSLHLRIELARLVQLRNVDFAFDVIAMQLCDKDSTFVIECDARRLLNHRLACHQLDPKPVR